jgi:undecaprenyl pyrophosphate synthase
MCTDIMLKDSNVKETIQLCKYLSIAHKKKFAFTQENWYRMDVVQLVKHTKQYLKFYAKALELKHHSTLFYTYIRFNL